MESFIKRIVNVAIPRIKEEYMLLSQIDAFKLGFNNARKGSISKGDLPELSKSLSHVKWSEIKPAYEAGWDSEKDHNHWALPLVSYLSDF